MAKLNYKKCETVYVCCGEYIIPIANAKKKEITCPRCGKILTEPLKLPNIILVKTGR